MAHPLLPGWFIAVDGTELTQMNPLVTLWTTGSDNEPIPLFTVTASDDGQGFAPTGLRVFGHVNIPFWNNDRRLRMDFTSGVSYVEIIFGGGTPTLTEVGRLQVYDSNDILLAEYVTDPLNAGESELMTMTRGAADIAWAIAFISDGEGSFGRLDDLSFTAGISAGGKSHD